MFGEELSAFREVRAETIKMADQLLQEQMNYSPAPRRWSAGEVLDHLVLADDVYRKEISELIKLKRAGKQPVIKRSLTDLDVSVALIPKHMLSAFELPLTVLGKLLPRPMREFMLRSRLFPAQNPDRATPRQGRAVDELKRDLRSSLKATEALFVANADLDYRELVHQHPLLGTNNVLQIIRFMRLHEERHQDQLRELFDLSDFPAGEGQRGANHETAPRPRPRG